MSSESIGSANTPVVFIDGVCNLCNNTVRFILKRDPGKKLSFASLQSDISQEFLRANGMDPGLQSVVFYENGQIYNKSSAVLRISKYLSGLWPACVILLAVPRFIRNAVYDFIAARRYKWFGTQDELCGLIPPEDKERFLDL